MSNPPPPITGSHAEDTLQLFESLIDNKLMITITENMRRNLINAVLRTGGVVGKEVHLSE